MGHYRGSGTRLRSTCGQRQLRVAFDRRESRSSPYDPDRVYTGPKTDPWRRGTKSDRFSVNSRETLGAAGDGLAQVGAGKARSESKNAFFAVLSTEGRVAGICWAKLKPKGPKGGDSHIRLSDVALVDVGAVLACTSRTILQEKSVNLKLSGNQLYYTT